MFELTNEQRVHFGLQPVESDWIRLEPMNSHAWATTIAYIDGTVIRKYIATGDQYYMEYELCEQVSDDFRYIMPKTAKGKPVLLSASTLEKRRGRGMCLYYIHHRPNNVYSYISLYSLSSEKVFYSSEYDPICIPDIMAFQQWVENWCSEATQDDLTAITRFASLPRQHVKFQEGDVFRFRINRHLYGYGRIILDYTLMRKKKVPFWDVLMGKPLVCSVYHIATERDDVSIEELGRLGSLPSVHIMDNHLFYGTYKIIGNIPTNEAEDHPIIYGGSVDARYRSVLLQCGKLYRRNDNATVLFHDFTNFRIGFGLNFTLTVLLACIENGSNTPYWIRDNENAIRDLRNPKFRTELEQVCKQFDLEPYQLIK